MLIRILIALWLDTERNSIKLFFWAPTYVTIFLALFFFQFFPTTTTTYNTYIVWLSRRIRTRPSTRRSRPDGFTERNVFGGEKEYRGRPSGPRINSSESAGRRAPLTLNKHIPSTRGRRQSTGGLEPRRRRRRVIKSAAIACTHTLLRFAYVTVHHIRSLCMRWLLPDSTSDRHFKQNVFVC